MIPVPEDKSTETPLSSDRYSPKKNNAIEGTYILDPSLEIPSAWLPPLPEEETEGTRSNFYAKSEFGRVTSELYLLDRPILRRRKKVLLNISSPCWTTRVHIHREGPSPPFTLHSHSTSLLGDITVKIPRSFKGSITAGTKHGRVLMSDAISNQASVFSDLLGVKRLYVGDIAAINDEIDDAMVLDNERGCARISFEDEDFVANPDAGCVVG
ncbi:hypothetical protein BDP27DRAFT_1424893 [Rhodocollybia butyracea]|uniref:DUF7330 domain-containing protein n=1 Tax=Rhodocollybia butyracea TaxID=206335 RepID=A0A9P5PLA5_9AGAR|nr:hypothetical protein BDP27DRAFT_1424893 [Rhodocollybia butyracea]